MDNKHKHLKRIMAFVLSAAITFAYMPSGLMAYAESNDVNPTQVAEEEQPRSEVPENESEADKPDAGVTAGTDDGNG